MYLTEDDSEDCEVQAKSSKTETRFSFHVQVESQVFEVKVQIQSQVSNVKVQVKSGVADVTVQVSGAQVQVSLSSVARSVVDFIVVFVLILLI